MTNLTQVFERRQGGIADSYEVLIIHTEEVPESKCIGWAGRSGDCRLKIKKFETNMEWG
jgi:hypothetical protein